MALLIFARADEEFKKGRKKNNKTKEEKMLKREHQPRTRECWAMGRCRDSETRDGQTQTRKSNGISYTNVEEKRRSTRRIYKQEVRFANLFLLLFHTSAKRNPQRFLFLELET